MTARALAIEKQALKLSMAEREWLVKRLLAQTEDEQLTAVDEAWVAESERRFSEWKRKKRRAFLAAKAITDIRLELHQ